MIKNKITSEEFRKMQLYETAGLPLPRKHKYNVCDKEARTWKGFFRGREQEIIFDSRKEMERFKILVIAYNQNKISNLQLQERFLVGTDPVIYYVADFLYCDKDKIKWVVEDVKGVRTQTYKRKKRLFEKKYLDIEFIEI